MWCNRRNVRRHSKDWLIEAYQADLTIIEELPLGGAHLATASALFDLALREFVDALVARLSGQATALYAALNYDGTTEWLPTHPLDDTVLAAFTKIKVAIKALVLHWGQRPQFI